MTQRNCTCHCSIFSMIYNVTRQQWPALITGQSIILVKLMYYDGLAIAVHVLTPSAGLLDYCASGEVVCNWGICFAQSRLKTDLKKKKGGNQFVWAYRGILYTLIMAKEIGQKSTAKSTQFPVKEFPNALTHNHPCGIHSFFSKIYNLLLSCDMLMVLLVVHVNGETHLLHWHIVPANICH